MLLGELHLTEHSLFQAYIDVCRLRPGQDHDWTVGNSAFCYVIMFVKYPCDIFGDY